MVFLPFNVLLLKVAFRQVYGRDDFSTSTMIFYGVALDLNLDDCSIFEFVFSLTKQQFSIEQLCIIIVYML